MADLTKFAKGRPCEIRVAGFCRGQRDHSVWAHVRLIGISAAGMKAPDVLGAIACDVCHDIVDGRRMTNLFSYPERRLLLLEGVARSLALLHEEGLLKW